MLAARNLCVPAGRRHADLRLDDVDLSVRPGEVVALMGPNGAGKSTLLACCSGALVPARGSVVIDGLALARHDRRALARRLAVLPQHSPLSFGLSVAEVVLLGRTPHGTLGGGESDHDHAVVRRVLHEVGIAALEQRDYTSLSGGEQQRVHLARVLAQVWDPSPVGPRYLLLDEPTAALDPRHQHDLLGLCRDLAHQGLGVLLTLHDVQLAVTYADRLVLLRDGRVLSDAPTTDLDPARLGAAFDIDVVVLRDPSFDHPVLATRSLV